MIKVPCVMWTWSTLATQWSTLLKTAAIVKNLTVIHPTPLRPTAFHPTALRPTAFHPTALQPTTLHLTALYSTVLQPSALHISSLPPTVLRPTVLHPTALQPILLRYLALYPTVILQLTLFQLKTLYIFTYNLDFLKIHENILSKSIIVNNQLRLMHKCFIKQNIFR